MDINKLRFKDFVLTEGISSGSIEKATFLMIKYLKKKTGLNLFAMPELEQYKGSAGKGFGLRLFANKKGISVRLNFSSTRAQTNALTGFDVWLGDGKPSTRVEFANMTSVVKILPIVAEIINNKGSNSKVVYTIPDGVPLNEGYAYGTDSILLKEAAGAGDVPAMFDDIVDMIVSPNFSKGKIYRKYKSAGVKVFEALEEVYPKNITKQGVKYVFSGKPAEVQKIKKDKSKILEMIGANEGKVTKGSAKETYADNSNADELLNDRERLSFEAQLEDLENLLKLTVNGAANAIFIAGRGGVGKTFTTEKILGEMGYRDGAGYFKNTGSASAAGMYSLLFKYKNEIIFFDDSDDALKDQESRNLLKAATDTKKIRKLVWNKMGKNVAEPDEMTDDEILDAGLIPRYFEFTGKIIFISNLKMNKLDPDGALRTRAFIIDIDPTEGEIYDFMDKIVGKISLEEGLTLDLTERKRVVDLLRKGKSKQSSNLRKLSRGLNMAAGALKAGVAVADKELARMIEIYA